MGLHSRFFGMLIVGGGPAGLAPLLAAHRNGNLDALLDQGVVIVERSNRLGCGTIGNYGINSDSSGRTFVDCLLGERVTPLTRLFTHPLTEQLATAGDGAVPLRAAGRFLELVGEALGGMVASHPACEVLKPQEAVSAMQVDGGWSVIVHDPVSGADRTILARSIVVATGASQPAWRLANESVGGINIVERCQGRLMQSGEVLARGGLDRVATLLAGKRSPRVVIVGGSTSAAAVAHALLNRMPNVQFGPSGVTLLHRRPLRIYYPDRASALAEGYTEWTEADVCQISGKVFRFAGFRLDSRELVMQARGIGGRAPEPRLRLHQLQAGDQAALELLDQADLVIPALGYRPHGLPLFDRNGQAIALLSSAGPQQPMVDGECRLLGTDGVPVPGAYGIGLGAGFVPRGRLGGETSFRGQANGLWLWQHDVGALIVEAVLQQPHAALERLVDMAAPHGSAAMVPPEGPLAACLDTASVTLQQEG